MILIKERQWKLILLRMVFSDYTKRRILFYHTKGYYAPTIVGLLQKEDIQVSRRSVKARLHLIQIQSGFVRSRLNPLPIASTLAQHVARYVAQITPPTRII